jgi:hypothetical protein
MKNKWDGKWEWDGMGSAMATIGNSTPFVDRCLHQRLSETKVLGPVLSQLQASQGPKLTKDETKDTWMETGRGLVEKEKTRRETESSISRRAHTHGPSSLGRKSDSACC